MLVFERDKAPNAAFVPRFPSEIPSTKPVDVVKPKDSPSMLCLYHSADQTPVETQRRSEDGWVRREVFTV